MQSIPIINSSWTLFLDRDGVINKEKKDGYIQQWSEFQFYDHALEAIATLSKHFGIIVIVTNQRGIGKKLMSTQDLENIHHNMLRKIIEANGRIDKIYYCPDIDNSSSNRKPNIGMALQAKKNFPKIQFDKSIIVGNTINDMRFGKNVGMYTVFITTTQPAITLPNPFIDFQFDSLFSFAQMLHNP